MSVESYMRLDNKAAILAELNATGKDVQDQVVKNLKASGETVRDALRDSLPAAPGEETPSSPGGVPYSQTGNLKSKIGAKILPLQLNEPITLSIFVSQKGFYGRMLEFGTSKMAARPWFFSGIGQRFSFLKDSIADAVSAMAARKNKRLGNK
jgi:HK97 gp10 family phage protein